MYLELHEQLSGDQGRLLPRAFQNNQNKPSKRTTPKQSKTTLKGSKTAKKRSNAAPKRSKTASKQSKTKSKRSKTKPKRSKTASKPSNTVIFDYFVRSGYWSTSIIEIKLHREAGGTRLSGKIDTSMSELLGHGSPLIFVAEWLQFVAATVPGPLAEPGASTTARSR